MTQELGDGGDDGPDLIGPESYQRRQGRLPIGNPDLALLGGPATLQLCLKISLWN